MHARPRNQSMKSKRLVATLFVVSPKATGWKKSKNLWFSCSLLFRTPTRGGKPTVFLLWLGSKKKGSKTAGFPDGDSTRERGSAEGENRARFSPFAAPFDANQRKQDGSAIHPKTNEPPAWRLLKLESYFALKHFTDTALDLHSRAVAKRT